ncbi:unnamed protein product [Rotaria sp. Silwood1]|nr:unnamed protein product [Rotaria sp. Silwood1]CAF1618586.1 unnamed protein product [Rotaria sp. Silwood1]CAF3466592.1 unnamed protein product [Rotaria sp. Silwood1]CAF3814921.1 unnamed protein product [Rotaria sp. Silwood1]CAF4874179.1 unnamed protein product [Rotaria sp. Silwood1]
MHTAFILTNGKVLVVHEGKQDSPPDGTAELYDSSTGIWITTHSINNALYGHRVSTLRNGRVSYTSEGTFSDIFSSVELYDPLIETWTTTGNRPMHDMITQ